MAAALAAAGVGDGHLAVELVGEGRIRELNRRHRGIDRPTDVLAFPVDGVGEAAGPRELGDVAICPAHAEDVTEAAVHGVLHLCGYDHEAGGGEMLALQRRVLAELGRLSEGPAGQPTRAGFAGQPTRAGPAGQPTRAGPAGQPTRAGFAGLAGRPNVGKSTLVNALVGAKVAIVSERPQTTRRAVRGVATDPAAGWQIVLVDLPGVQRPRDVLTERMQRRVERELADSDVALLVIDAEQGVGPGDRFIAGTLLAARAGTPVICAVNKSDRADRAAMAAALDAAARLEAVDEVFPVSARTGAGLGPLTERLAELMPEGPLLYPPGERSDQPSEVLLAELIREQVLRRTREELPHAVEVAVQEVERRADGLVTVRAEVWAETESQKGILIGKGGAGVRAIGTAARAELERELDARVHLDLKVRVRKRWRRDEALLDRLGIE